jgi:hypothetical protein
MSKFLLLLVSVLSLIVPKAQVRVSGMVKDARGHLLQGVSITLHGTYDGAVSDSAGYFSFKTFEQGEKLVEAKLIGYKTIEQKVVLIKEPLVLGFSLREEVSELKAVTVTAGSFEAGDRKRAATVLSTLDILTTGGANADITATVKTLPGAQQIGEQEGLFVRGGAGYETKQFIDGTLVNNPYYSSVPDLAQRGRFSPDLFKGTIFSTGGYSALYGQALSSALILESIDMPDSTVFAGAGLQELAKDKKYSWGFNYGYTNVWPYFQVVKQKIDYFRVPEYHTGDANFRIKTKRGIIKYYTTFSYNHLGIRRPDVDSSQLKDAFGLENVNWYNNLSWRESLSGGWKMNLGASFSINHDLIDQQLQNQNNRQLHYPSLPWLDSANYTWNNRENLAQVKAVFDKRISGISVIRFGGEYWYAYNKSIYNDTGYLLPDHLVSLFSEGELHITNELAATLGVRLEHSSQINKTDIAPRIALAYKTGRNAQISAAYGIFYQKPELAQLMYTTNLGFTKATHYIINYIKNTPLQTFRIEAFYKKYDDLVKTFPVYNNAGSGYAQGIELYWRDKKTIRNLDYWISYSYLDTKRDYLNYPQQLQPGFAANHTASLVVKRFFQKLNTGFNFTYSFATGRPYYDIVYNNSNAKYIIADQGKTIDYNNLGFSMNYLTRIKKAFAVVVASVTNVLGNNLVYGYNYSHNGLYKQAINPPAPRFFFIGLFLSWGVDRRQDAINNNL